MDKQHILAAWLAGGIVWLSAVGGIAMMDDGAPSYEFIDQRVEQPWADDRATTSGAAVDDVGEEPRSADGRV